MNLKLIPFSSCPFEINVNIVRNGDEFILRYDLKGDLSNLVLPEINSSGLFKDGLWEHCCFELFIKDSGQTSYTEFNFSPTGDYAAYRFNDYRKKNLDFRYCTFPQIRTTLEENHLWMDIVLPSISGDLALCAVLEDNQGEKHYFALAHKNERPDFHHPASFIFSI